MIVNTIVLMFPLNLSIIDSPTCKLLSDNNLTVLFPPRMIPHTQEAMSNIIKVILSFPIPNIIYYKAKLFNLVVDN